MAEAIINVESLAKRYGRVTAVENVSFDIFEGEIFGMVGPNGAGKTTTIECCNGLRKPDEGSVKVFGLNPYDKRSEIYQYVGVQLQETSYQDKIRIEEICVLISSLFKNPVDYRQLLERFELGNKRRTAVSKLSGGQKQKLTIILALIPDPRLVFLDELTTGLDPKSRRDMWQYIRELQQSGKTIFMTTHYMEEAEYLCNRLAIINHGSLACIDTIENLLNQEDLEHLVTFKSRDVVLSKLEKVEGIHRVEREGETVRVFADSQRVLSRVVLFLEHENITYDNLRSKNADLEDVFLKLTGDKFDSSTD